MVLAFELGNVWTQGVTPIVLLVIAGWLAYVLGGDEARGYISEHLLTTKCYSPTLRLDLEAVEELVRRLAWSARPLIRSRPGVLGGCGSPR